MAFPAPSTRAGRFLSEGLSLDLTQTRERHRVGGGPQASRESQGQPGPSLSRGSRPGRQRPEAAREAESSCKLSPTRHPACTGRGGASVGGGAYAYVPPSQASAGDRRRWAQGQRPGGWRALCQAWPLPQSKCSRVNSVLSRVAPALDPVVGQGVEAAGNGAEGRTWDVPPTTAAGAGGPRAPPPFSGAPPEHSPRWPQPLSHKASLHRRTSTPRIHSLTVCPPSSSCSGPGRLIGRDPQAGSRQTACQ